MQVIYIFFGLLLAGSVLTLFMSRKEKRWSWLIAFLGALGTFSLGLRYLLYGGEFLPHSYFFCDSLSACILLGIGFFGMLVSLYTKEFLLPSSRFFTLFLLTLLAASGVAFSHNLFFLLFFWGILGILLFAMVSLSGSSAADSAKKTALIIIGSDALLLFGIAGIWYLTGTVEITALHIPITRWLSGGIFLSIAIAGLAKAGAMPFHSWIPDISETASIPVMAFLPASLDKLLGIYLLARICNGIFVVHEGLWLLLRSIGALTILGAVFMALVQKDIRKLLAYHAVSQVGYMVLGIASATPFGVLGGLFHMVNHALYKSALFLGAGAIQREVDSTDIKSLGGLAPRMPYTFLSMLIASLAISGIPPLNGFFSKLFIYRGLLDSAGKGGISWLLLLAAAMLGSALTLASFLKLLYATFLGRRRSSYRVSEAPVEMVIPQLLLSFFCIIFGLFFKGVSTGFFGNYVFAFLASIPPEKSFFILDLSLAMLLGAIGAGMILFCALFSKPVRLSPPFVGGESVTEAMYSTGEEFYQTIREMPPFTSFYALAEQKVFDLYESLRSFCHILARGLRSLHTGGVGTYIAWFLVGMIAILFLLSRQAGFL
jgi:formate hydrogenlyase subunit 3/multisubunit Na+/H+ antiporter MnhD subunit